MSIKDKIIQLLEKAKYKSEQSPESDGITSADNPKPHANYFKSKPIIATIAVIGIMIIVSVAISPKISGKSEKVEEKKETKTQTEYQAVDNTKNLPSSYGEIKKYNERVRPIKAIEEKQETQREQKKSSYKSLPPTPPEVPKQKNVQRAADDRVLNLMKEKEAANRSQIEFKVNR